MINVCEKGNYYDNAKVMAVLRTVHDDGSLVSIIVKKIYGR